MATNSPRETDLLKTTATAQINVSSESKTETNVYSVNKTHNKQKCTKN